jgi:hypothetical protein
MFKQNIDFFAVLSIALAMLGFTEARSWHFPEALDSIRIEKAIEVERCPISRQVVSNIRSILH